MIPQAATPTVRGLANSFERAADLGLSPQASDDFSVVTPGFGETTLSPFLSGNEKATSYAEVQALPGPSLAPLGLDVATSPAQEMPPCLQLDAIVGAAIDPAPSQTPSLPSVVSKSGPGLRLPSFELLGIANAHSHRLQQAPAQGVLSPTIGGENAGTTTHAECDHIMTPDHIQSDSATWTPPVDESHARAKNLHPQFPTQVITTLTPPDESRQTPWSKITTVSANPMESPMADPDSASTSSLQRTATAPAPASTQPRIQIQRSNSDIARGSFLEDASKVMMKNLQSSLDLVSPIRVLSHALPCPSTVGFAFPVMISSLHNQTPGTPTCWINVFHALPGQFSLSNLPTSPPSTPGPAVGGDDYFTSKVFDSAVPVLDYQENLTSLPKTPRPIVPPSTIHVSIVERYIPPTNANEFSEMFNLHGRSLLTDRLMELSPSNGTLLFIYPTRAGGNTFIRDYLSPILDPLLRSMCVVNSLSVDLGAALGRMSAVESMLSYEDLEAKIAHLCNDVSHQSRTLDRFQGAQATFTLDYASKETVKLDRKVWAENWWVKQEKPRVRDIVTRYFRLARKLPTDSEIVPTTLIHEVLDGVVKRPYANHLEPESGLEVGVFVIRRSA